VALDAISGIKNVEISLKNNTLSARWTTDDCFCTAPAKIGDKILIRTGQPCMHHATTAATSTKTNKTRNASKNFTLASCSIYTDVKNSSARNLSVYICFILDLIHTAGRSVNSASETSSLTITVTGSHRPSCQQLLFSSVRRSFPNCKSLPAH